MGTRSTIGYLHADGSVDVVYCHWDGYLEHNGRILNEHYRDPEKVQKLVAGGSISSLAPEVGDAPHDFDDHDARHKITTFYHRDHGEPLEAANHYQSVEEWARLGDMHEYAYLFDPRDTSWSVVKQTVVPERVPLDVLLSLDDDEVEARLSS